MKKGRNSVYLYSNVFDDHTRIDQIIHMPLAKMQAFKHYIFFDSITITITFPENVINYRYNYIFSNAINYNYNYFSHYF